MSVKRQDTYIYTLTVNALKIGPIHCRADSPAQCKKAVNEDWWYCCYFILHSKLDPYQDDLLYVRVINSLRGGFLRGFPRNTKTQLFLWLTKLTQLVCLLWLRRNLRNSFSLFFFSFFLHGYDKTYTTLVFYFTINHS